MYRHPYRNRRFRRAGIVPLGGPGAWEPDARAVQYSAAIRSIGDNSLVPTGPDLIDGYYDGDCDPELASHLRRSPGKWPFLIAGYYRRYNFDLLYSGVPVPHDKFPSHVRVPDALPDPIITYPETVN